MELKKYQQRVLDEISAYFDALAEEWRGGNLRHAAKDAWEQCKISRFYAERRTGANRDLPNFCLKVPTGGGKTLLATQIIGLAYKRLLPERNGVGLLLWIVPSDQIYRDTLKALKDRRHFYRESLDYALGQPIEIWEKHEIARLTPAQMRTKLNILVIKLQGTNRQDKESLKFFRDSGGNITQHFPAEDDPEANRALKARIPNLDMIQNRDGTDADLIKTSIGNLARLCEPIVMLDEGHKATSALALATVEGFNPRLIVELSATPPKEANLLCRVSGQELLDEQMIKLPIRVVTSREESWTNCLTRARDKREELAQIAREQSAVTQRTIRPIVLVQVERVGKDQRDTNFIHSEEVREWLIGRLGVPAAAVAVKTSERDDIEGIDLLDENCPIEWIITKAALQEGWDCPYAYILVSLSNTRSQQSMTQLVGRVLRQPFAAKTPARELNESYVYCLRASTEQVVAEIRKALSGEGYEGDAASVIDDSGETTKPETREAKMRLEFARQYLTPFEGRVFLPRFCVRFESGDQPLDYYSHLLSGVNVREFDYEPVREWDLTADIRSAKEIFRSVSLNENALEPIDREERDLILLDTDAQTKAWLASNLGEKRFSAKQCHYIVEQVCQRLQGVENQLAYARFRLLERMTGLVKAASDRQTQAIFQKLYDEGRLFFGIACIQCVFELPPSVKRKRIRAMTRNDTLPLQKDLFDFQPDDMNELEKVVALYLDESPEVLWWYRNIVGVNEFSIEGWKPNKLYPDFIVQRGEDGAAKPTVWIVESKGRHLSGNADTEYKRDVAKTFEKLGEKVTWQKLGEDFADHCFRFQVLDQGDYADKDWKADLQKMLTASLTPS